MEENKLEEISDTEELEENQMADINDILGNQASTYEEENKDREDDGYIKIYSGDDLGREELYLLSACEDINLVLVAGPTESGKTTLEVMMYYLFLEGLNTRIRFSGSYTIKGYQYRSRKLLYQSGENRAKTDRTPRGETKYLHLSLEQETGNKKNLLFADITGEFFQNKNELKNLDSVFEKCENVILVIDGDKLCDEEQRSNIEYNYIVLIKQLIGKSIICGKTKLQVVCSKQDKNKEEKNAEETEQYIQNVFQVLNKQFIKEVLSIHFYYLSALKIEDSTQSSQLEDILLKCMEANSEDECNIIIKNKIQPEKYFDKYEYRGKRNV